MSEADKGEVLVKVEGVSKKFCRSLKKSLWYGVCDIAGELNPLARKVEGGKGQVEGIRKAEREQNSAAKEGKGAGLRPGEFWAVQDVSFELRRGECLGLIGHNGAGKTTLLKMLNGLIKPDRGSITMRGRVGALIALGAGFNPILTGRENIFINGSVLGLSKKEIDEKIDEIIDFAEIREFIDMPVQNYSSGMTVRLGFAVASTLQPDVLILDEVLAVGDASFRHKCYERMDALRSRAAIIFVSHNMPDVGRICQRTVVMDRGQVVFQGPALDGIGHFNRLNERWTEAAKVQRMVRPPLREFTVEAPGEVDFNGAMDLKIRVVADEDLGPVDLTVALTNETGGYAAVGLCKSEKFGIAVGKGLNEWCCRLANIPLRNGVYPLTVHLINSKGDFVALECNARRLRITGAYDGIPGECQLQISQWQ